MVTMTKPTPRLTARHGIIAAIIVALAVVAAIVLSILMLEGSDREAGDEASQLDELICYPDEPGC